MNNRSVIIFKKTIVEFIRDKSTYATLLSSAILFPVIIVGLLVFTSVQSKPKLCLDLPINKSDEIFNSIDKSIRDSNITIVSSKNPERLLSEGKIDCIISSSDNNTIDFIYRAHSYNSYSVASRIGQAVQQSYSNSLHHDGKIWILKLSNNKNDEIKALDEIINILFPLVLISIYTKGLCSYTDDIFAGEKERKTLEWLLISNIKKARYTWEKLALFCCLLH